MENQNGDRRNVKHTPLAGVGKYTGKATIHKHRDRRKLVDKTKEITGVSVGDYWRLTSQTIKVKIAVKEPRQGVTSGVCFNEVLDWSADG